MNTAPSAHELHQKQVEYWNGAGGSHWVEEQERTDRMLAPIEAAVLAHAAPKPGESVIDVGCGCGSTAIENARRVGPTGRVIGADVSAPMLELARHRAKGIANLEFVLGDVAAHKFAAGSADLIFSKFGVMFFGDPTAAFTNLRRALKPGGRLAFVCWRKLDENVWMKEPMMAAVPHVPPMPRPGPDDPGPLSFADTERVTRILTGAGFAKPNFKPLDVKIDVGNGRGIEGAVAGAMKIGPVSRALIDQPADAIAKVQESMRAAFACYAQGDKVEMPGAVWLVGAN